MTFHDTGISGHSECIELHVLFIPDEDWNSRLNKVSVETIDSFISAGFISVHPNVGLKAIREELGSLLGPHMIMDRYSFLKCVGRSLALVKDKQEKYLKAKSFAPPYSPYPELYLLQVDKNTTSVTSRSLSSDTVIINTDPQTCCPPRPVLASDQTKQPNKFPLIKERLQQCVTDQSLEDGGSFDSLQEEFDSLGFEDSMGTESEKMCWNIQKEAVVNQHEVISSKQTFNAMGKDGMQTYYKINCASDSKRPKLQNPGTGIFYSHERKPKLPQTLNATRTKISDKVLGRPETMVPDLCPLAPHDSSPNLYMQKATPVPSTNGDEIISEIGLIKEEKKQLVRTRQELLKKSKELLVLNRQFKNQARDKWKRKYFDAKKTTAPLEETLKSLCQELETFYGKLFQQLQMRDLKNRQRRGGKLSSTKNDLITQIMKERCEIDNLKKTIDDAKMKLATEIKLWKQAVSELQSLKAELMQKKCVSTYTPQAEW